MQSIPKAHIDDENGIVIETDTAHKFGSSVAIGLQHKGLVEMNDDHYFVKLDELNPSVNGTWNERFDSQYSSISETVTSVFAKHIKPRPNFDSVTYEFNTFQIGDKRVTGTYSKNYLKEHEVEHVLSVDTVTDQHLLMDIGDYAETVVDVPIEDRFNKLTEILSDYNVPKNNVEQFLINQAAFDMMTGNRDRLHNPSNFIIAFNHKDNQGRLVNFDYGRTLPLDLWTKTTESNYTDDFLQEDLASNFWSTDMVRSNDSIVTGSSKSESINFLKSHGFKPFELDKTALIEDLDKLQNQFDKDNLPCQKYATTKIEAFKQVLDQEWVKELYTDISVSELGKEKSIPSQETDYTLDMA